MPYMKLQAGSSVGLWDSLSTTESTLLLSCTSMQQSTTAAQLHRYATWTCHVMLWRAGPNLLCCAVLCRAVPGCAMPLNVMLCSEQTSKMVCNFAYCLIIQVLCRSPGCWLWKPSLLPMLNDPGKYFRHT